MSETKPDAAEADRDPREELAEIAASVRAYLEWHVDTGTVGMPRLGRRPAPTAPEAAASPTTPSPMVAAPPPLDARPLPALPVDAPAATAAEVAPVAPVAPVASRGPVTLEMLADEVRGCQKCGLARTRTNTVFSRGNPSARLVFVGEAPGADEDAQGKPFVGRAGQLLDRMIAAMGLDPERDVYICNILKCRPPDNRRPEQDEIDTCIPYLHQQLDLIKPKAIVALGNTAVQALLGIKIGITKVRGDWKLYKGTTVVMPTYHPSYLIRPSAQQAEAKRQAWEDLQKVMQQLGLKLPTRGGKG